METSHDAVDHDDVQQTFLRNLFVQQLEDSLEASMDYQTELMETEHKLKTKLQLKKKEGEMVGNVKANMEQDATTRLAETALTHCHLTSQAARENVAVFNACVQFEEIAECHSYAALATRGDRYVDIESVKNCAVSTTPLMKAIETAIGNNVTAFPAKVMAEMIDDCRAVVKIGEDRLKEQQIRKEKEAKRLALEERRAQRSAEKAEPRARKQKPNHSFDTVEAALEKTKLARPAADGSVLPRSTIHGQKMESIREQQMRNVSSTSVKEKADQMKRAEAALLEDMPDVDNTVVVRSRLGVNSKNPVNREEEMVSDEPFDFTKSQSMLSAFTPQLELSVNDAHFNQLGQETLNWIRDMKSTDWERDSNGYALLREFQNVSEFAPWKVSSKKALVYVLGCIRRLVAENRDVVSAAKHMLGQNASEPPHPSLFESNAALRLCVLFLDDDLSHLYVVDRPGATGSGVYTLRFNLIQAAQLLRKRAPMSQSIIDSQRIPSFDGKKMLII